MKQYLHLAVRSLCFLLLGIAFAPLPSHAGEPTDPAPFRETAADKFIKVNVYGGTNPYTNTEWNNWNTGSAAGTNKTSGTLKYSDGTTSTISAVLSATAALGDNGATYGGVMAPAEVLRYSSNHNATRNLTFNGLSSSKTYSLELYASRNKTSQGNTIFTIGNTSVAINVVNNLTEKAVFTALQANAQGQIVVNVSNSSTYNYINGFILTETAATSGGNEVPSANAGSDKSITLPASSTTLSGSGTDGDGTIAKYAWSQVSGPNQATINSPSSASTAVSGLIQGTYTFRLTVTDNGGASSTDDVAVTVNGTTSTVTNVFNPNDPVVNYDAANPPVKPATGKVGKWVRTPRVSWNTSSYKCYIYNGMAFRLKFPKNYDSTKAYPMLIFFHGLGEYGTIYDNEFQLSLGGALHSNAVDDGKFNGFLLYPQSTNEQFSSGLLTTIDNLVEKVMIPLGMVDPFQVYIDGLSAGATSGWTFLSKYTKLVSAATLISSASNSLFDSAQKYKFTPIYHFQGGQDISPTPAMARSLGNKILGIGGNYKYKEYPNRAHDSWYQAWGESDYFAFYDKAHKANPWALFGRTEFCNGDTIGITLGVTPGFDGYEWRKNGSVIAGANSNTLQVSELGTYDCRIKSGTTWSDWSPIPVTIRLKPLTVQPSITISGAASNVIPAPDGSTAVPLEVPEGYATYNWIKEGSTTTLSNTNKLSATTPGNYKVQVTEKFGCGIETSVTTIPSQTVRVEAESYTAMKGIRLENCSDVGGGQDLGNIDLNDWMDYTINAPTTGNYLTKFRVSSGATGAQFQVQDAGGAILATINVPGTGGWQKFVDVNTVVALTKGAQSIRLLSIATPRWNINYFDLTNPAGTSGTGDGYSAPFLVVNASGSNAPDPASNLSVTATSKTAVQLQWSQTPTPAFNETGFEIYQATAAEGPYNFMLKTVANATSAAFSNLNSGTTYYYKVRAVNNNGASAVAGPVNATTLADRTPPSTPLNLTVVTSATNRSSIQLTWTASTDDVGVTNYDIYVNGVKSYAVGKVTKGIVYNLIPNTTYTFYVKARDQAGNESAASNTVSAKTATGALKLDPTMGSNPSNFSVYMNMNVDNPASSPWNNTNVLPSEGTVFSNLRSYASNNSGAKMKIVDNFSGYNPNGVNTGSNSGVYPDNVMRSAYYCDKGQVAKLQIYDLSLNHKYSFIFFGSRAGTGDRTSVYTIGNKSVSLNASDNSTQTVQIDEVMPDQNGVVTIEISLGQNAIFAYLNALVIKGYSLTGTQAVTRSATNSLEAVPETNTVALAQVYPNPVVTNATLTLPLAKAAAAITVQVSDANGSVLSTQVFKNVPQGTWQQRIPLNGKAAQPGVYFIRVSGLPNGATQVLKVLKAK